MIRGKAVVEIEGAENIYRAILPELKSAPSDRALTKLILRKNRLKLIVEARDASSFKASLGSCIRWIKLARKIEEGVK